MNKEHLIIYGGTFDPIHNGHLNTAKAVLSVVKDAVILFIPCKQPLLKKRAAASANNRLDMIKIAIKNIANTIVDDRELTRNTPSYMVDTLISLRKEYPNHKISLLLGVDAFNSLPKWYRWQEILKLANLIIINRPGHMIESARIIQQLISDKQIYKSSELSNLGAILFLNLAENNVSSTKIRKCHQLVRNIVDYLPKVIQDYIKTHDLYKK
jgi:nicotinate-nucleotide adenylyltransferase